MTNDEWKRLHPEDWHPASEVETFDPNKFDIRWDETYSMFRAVKLAWGAGNRSYVRYQCGGE